MNIQGLAQLAGLGPFIGYGDYTGVERVILPTVVKETEQGQLITSIVEQNATMFQQSVELLGQEDELDKFRKLYDGDSRISCPHLLVDYKTVDRNRCYTEEAVNLSGDPFNKISDSLFTGFTSMDHMDEAMYSLVHKLSHSIPVDEMGLPLLQEGPDLNDISLIVNAGRANTGRGDFGAARAGTKHEHYTTDITTANRILSMLRDGDYCVPIIPCTTSAKQENIKYDKGTRYIAVEHAAINVLSQIIVGHYIDTKVGCSLNCSMNGLTPQYGVLPHIFDRQLRNQTEYNFDWLERILKKHQDSDTLNEAIDEINSWVVMVVSDFKNFEFNHNPLAKIVSRLTIMLYYVPDRQLAKLLAWWFEMHMFAHLLLGASKRTTSDQSAAILITRPGTVMSGTLDTLFGNNEIQDFMHSMALCYIINKYPSSEALDKYILWVSNKIMMGDDFSSLLNPCALPFVLEHSWYLATVLYQHLKYEYKQFICKPSPLGFNFNAGDFLKTCAMFDVETGKIIFFKPTDQFPLRVLAFNSPDLFALKLLASYSSMALQCAGNPFMYSVLKRMYSSAFDALYDQNLIKQIDTARTRGIGNLLAQTYVSIKPEYDNANKQEMKFKPDPLSMATTSVLEFPSWECVKTAAADNAQVLNDLRNDNCAFATFSVNHLTATAWSLKSFP